MKALQEKMLLEGRFYMEAAKLRVLGSSLFNLPRRG
jgi:hypothetical protein